jgi:hypothetical protein
MLKLIIISASIVFFHDVEATRKCGENRFGLDIFQTFEDFSPKFARRYDTSIAEWLVLQLIPISFLHASLFCILKYSLLFLISIQLQELQQNLQRWSFYCYKTT